MKTYKRLLIIGCWLATLIVAFYVGNTVASINNTFAPVTFEDVVVGRGQKNIIWIKKYSSDFRGDHPIIYLTEDKQRELPDPDKDLIFTNAESIFYRVNKDTLHIYSRIDHDIDSKFFENIHIVVHQLDNPKYMKLYDELHSTLKTTEWMK
jgi:hypothetical protein